MRNDTKTRPHTARSICAERLQQAIGYAGPNIPADVEDFIESLYLYTVNLPARLHLIVTHRWGLYGATKKTASEILYLYPYELRRLNQRQIYQMEKKATKRIIEAWLRKDDV